MLTASIDISPNLDAALRGLKEDVMLGAVQRGMTRAAELVAGQIIRDRLTGEGPFPVSAHQLGVRSGRYRKSLRATPAVISGLTVTTNIGARVKYAWAHEFGFSGNVPVKAHQRRKVALGKPNQKGKLTKKDTQKLKAVLRRSGSNSALVKAHQRKVNIPERAPIRTGIKDNLATFSNEVTREVKTTFGNP